MKILIATALATFGHLAAATACSPAPGWRDTNFWVVGGNTWDEEIEVTVTDTERLVIRTESFDVPAFVDFAPLLDITVTGPAGPIAGTLEPAPLIGHAIWVPDVPFVDGARYALNVQIQDSWREEGRTTAFIIDAAEFAPATGRWTLTAGKNEREVMGECVNEFEDSCGGFCEEREVLDTYMQIRLAFEIEVDDANWPEARAVRVAAGVDETEALAILDRTAFSNFESERGLNVAAYRNWPRDEVCGAIEIVDIVGDVLLREARCIAVVPDDELGAEINARLGREGGSARARLPGAGPDESPAPNGEAANGGGCSATGHDTAPAWALMLLGLAVRRRR